MNKVKKLLNLICTFIFLCSVTLEGYAMGGLGKVMFSAVQGVVLKDGKPLPGVKVVRTFNWAWNDATQKDEAITDTSGKFRFETAKRISLITSIFPHEPVIDQEIIIHHENKKYTAWFFAKRDYEENGELNGKKINIKCDINTPEGYNLGNKVWGICTPNQ